MMWRDEDDDDDEDEGSEQCVVVLSMPISTTYASELVSRFASAIDCNRIAFNNSISAGTSSCSCFVSLRFAFSPHFHVAPLHALHSSLTYLSIFFCVINLNIYSHYTKMSNISILREPVWFDIEAFIDFISYFWEHFSFCFCCCRWVEREGIV